MFHFNKIGPLFRTPSGQIKEVVCGDWCQFTLSLTWVSVLAWLDRAPLVTGDPAGVLTLALLNLSPKLVLGTPSGISF